jgi:cobalt-precorrin 5A hydrolase/precorrin-3B C17-methyltransferase
MAPVGRESRIRRMGAGILKVLVVSVTASGARIAKRLPYEHVHGNAGDTIRSRWRDYDAFVLVLATGAAVRIVAPLMESKATDPAIVCVDDSGRFAIALSGGHRAGANELATDVAQLLGAQPVITTSSERGGMVAIDAAPGFEASGDVAAVSRAMLDGLPIEIENPLGWPLPEAWERAAKAEHGSGDRPLLLVTDEALEVPSPELPSIRRPAALVRPPSLVAGVGTSTGAPPKEVARLLADVLDRAGLADESVREVATIDRRANEPAVLALGRPVRAYPSEQLALVVVPSPSAVVEAAVGTPSVSEAAALLAAGRGAVLVAPKQASRHATVALARRSAPRGSLAVVGLGPGASDHRTAAAAIAVRHAEVVIGYSAYVALAHDLTNQNQQIVRSDLGAEMDRARAALSLAASGRRVALVCSGDAGVYAMASPVLEIASEPEFSDVEIEIVPGVTAALAAGALLGAPLGHDYATVSLSDLLTPWEVVESRLEAAAASDFAVVLYNPRSARRDWQLERARQILLAHRSPATPVGVVTDAGRRSQEVVQTTLGDLDAEAVTMTSCVIVGSSSTRLVAGRMVTPRGYRR